MQDVLDKLCVMLQVGLDDHSDFSDLDFLTLLEN